MKGQYKRFVNSIHNVFAQIVNICTKLEFSSEYKDVGTSMYYDLHKEERI